MNRIVTGLIHVGFPVRLVVSLVLAGLAVRLRRLSGVILPGGHPLRTFELSIVDTLRHAERDYLAQEESRGV